MDAAARANGTSNTNTITLDYGPSALSGDLSVSGVNSYGASGVSSLAITVNHKPQTPVVTQSGNILTSSEPIGNQWYDSTGAIGGATAESYTVTATGDYYTIVTLLGCSSDTSNVVHAVVTAIDDNWTSSLLKLYPNPVRNELVFEMEGVGEVLSFEIVNTMGQVVSEGRIADKSAIHTTSLACGLYLIKIETSNECVLGQFMKY